MLPGGDKTAHFLAYAGLAVLVCLAMGLTVRGGVRSGGLTTLRVALGKSLAIAVAAMWAIGLFDELTQSLVGRYCSALDWLANCLGVLAGVCVMVLLHRKIVGRQPPAG